MVSKLALLSNLLLASATLAAPRLADRLTRRRENRQSQPLLHVESLAKNSFNISYSSNWAGAAWAEANGTFTTVTGTFIVPTPTGSDGAAAAWVGIDGNTCDNALLQTGVDFTISSGVVSYDAWYEWYPDVSYDFSGINISAGDVIKTTVVADSTTSGIAVIENLSTNQTVQQSLSSSYALCEQNAEWIVEDFSYDNGSLVPFADFGTVTFTRATAGSYSPFGADIFDIKQNGQVLTSVSTNVSSASLTIQYI